MLCNMLYLVRDAYIRIIVKVMVHVVASSEGPRDVDTVGIGANTARELSAVTDCSPRPPRLRAVNDRRVCQQQTTDCFHTPLTQLPLINAANGIERCLRNDIDLTRVASENEKIPCGQRLC